MDWVADLKHHTQEMHQQVLMFSQEYSIQHASEETVLKALNRYIDLFAAWVRALPSSQDVNVWQWLDWKRTSYSARSWLTVLEGYFDILPFVKEKENHATSSQPRSAREQNILKHMDRIDEIYNQASNSNHFEWSYEVEPQHLSAYTILALLWPLVYPQHLDRALSLSAFEMQNWPAVIYHPCDTHVLLEMIVVTLAPNDQNILIVPRKTDLHFEICVIQPGLSMTPNSWEIMRSSLDARNQIELLRELGGSIDPLTWDEGHGQGVIVRLPWAV